MAKWKKIKIGDYYTFEDENGEQLKDEKGKVLRFKDCETGTMNAWVDGWVQVETVGGWTFLNLDTMEAPFSHSKKLSELRGSFKETLSFPINDGWALVRDDYGYRLVNVNTKKFVPQVFTEAPAYPISLNGWFAVKIDKEWCLYNANDLTRLPLTKYINSIKPTSHRINPDYPLSVDDGWFMCNGQKLFNPEFMELSLAHPGKSLVEILRENPLEFEKLPTSYFTAEKRGKLKNLILTCQEAVIKSEVREKDEIEYNPEEAVEKVNELGGVIAEKIEREHTKIAELEKEELAKKGAAAKAKVEKHINETFDEIIKKI